MYIVTFIIISALILTNAITDAPNAIVTLVGTNVMKFNKATKISAIFNFLGIITMSFINISVANCMSSIVNLNTDKTGIIGLLCAMIAVIIFSLIALFLGIPTSETHGLIAGLTGSSIALYGFENAINIEEWKNVLVGLIWSVVGTCIVSVVISRMFNHFLDKVSNKFVKRAQVLGSIGMSFMHGAQDGQKFIGILIIFLAIYNNTNTLKILSSENYIWIVIFTGLLMFFGVSIGGKKIVEKVGGGISDLNNKSALKTDISTTDTLFIASLTGLPVSTTHVKTMAIVAESFENKNSKINKKTFLDIAKAWIYTFPICGVIAYILAYIYLYMFA